MQKVRLIGQSLVAGAWRNNLAWFDSRHSQATWRHGRRVPSASSLNREGSKQCQRQQVEHQLPDHGDGTPEHAGHREPHQHAGDHGSEDQRQPVTISPIKAAGPASHQEDRTAGPRRRQRDRDQRVQRRRHIEGRESEDQP